MVSELRRININGPQKCRWDVGGYVDRNLGGLEGKQRVQLRGWVVFSIHSCSQVGVLKGWVVCLVGGIAHAPRQHIWPL